MGGTTSAADTPFAKSIINKIFITTDSVAISYNKSYDCLFVSRWRIREIPCIPDVGDWKIKIPPGLTFQVGGVKKTQSINLSPFPRIAISFQKKIVIDSGCVLRVAFKKEDSSHAEWGDHPIKDLKTERLVNLRNEIELLEMKGGLLGEEFFCGIFEKFDFNKPVSVFYGIVDLRNEE